MVEEVIAYLEDRANKLLASLGPVASEETEMSIRFASRQLRIAADDIKNGLID